MLIIIYSIAKSIRCATILIYKSIKITKGDKMIKNNVNRRPKYLSPRLASEVSGLKLWTIYDLCDKNKVTHLRIGKSIYIDRVGFENFLKVNIVESNKIF